MNSGSPQGSSNRGPGFTPRRSYARARASRERVDALARMDRNNRSQQRFTRNLKLTINIVCCLGILALVIYAFFYARPPETDKDKKIDSVTGQPK